MTLQSQVVGVACSSRVPRWLSERPGKREFWVDKPRSNAAKDVREALLRQHFGFTEPEVEAFVAQTGFYVADAKSPKQPATPRQIAAWRTDPQGRVKITLTDYWIGEIDTFKQTTRRAAIERAAAFITDPGLRAVFVTQMQKLFNASGPERVDAFSILRNAMMGSTTAGPQVAAAIDAIEKTRGYDDNPYLALLRADIAANDYNTLVGPGYGTHALAHIGAAFRRLSAAEVSRAEAGFVRGELSRLYTALGDDDAATSHAWIQRLLTMTDAERAGYSEGSVVPMQAPGVRSVRAPNATEEKLASVERDWAARNARRARLAGVTAPRNADRDDALNRDVKEFRQTGVVRRKDRSRSKGHFKYEFGSTTTTVMDNTRIKQAGGALSLVTLVLKWAVADREMKEIAAYMAQREALEDKLASQRSRRFPPRPQKFRAAIRQAEALRNRTTDSERKQQAQTALAILYGALTESEAAWPGL